MLAERIALLLLLANLHLTPTIAVVGETSCSSMLRIPSRRQQLAAALACDACIRTIIPGSILPDRGSSQSFVKGACVVFAEGRYPPVLGNSDQVASDVLWNEEGLSAVRILATAVVMDCFQRGMSEGSRMARIGVRGQLVGYKVKVMLVGASPRS